MSFIRLSRTGAASTLRQNAKANFSSSARAMAYYPGVDAAVREAVTERSIQLISRSVVTSISQTFQKQVTESKNLVLVDFYATSVLRHGNAGLGSC
jgi:hypothetical protein